MITLVRIEGEADSLATLATELDAAQKALKLPKTLHVSDEHYELLGGKYKGRRVLRQDKAKNTRTVFANSVTTSSSVIPPRMT